MTDDGGARAMCADDIWIVVLRTEHYCYGWKGRDPGGGGAVNAPRYGVPTCKYFLQAARRGRRCTPLVLRTEYLCLLLPPQALMRYLANIGQVRGISCGKLCRRVRNDQSAERRETVKWSGGFACMCRIYPYNALNVHTCLASSTTILWPFRSSVLLLNAMPSAGYYGFDLDTVLMLWPFRWLVVLDID